MPEPVDTMRFNPSKVKRLTEPHTATWLKHGRTLGTPLLGAGGESPTFRFLSVFKWEARKAWDILLEAYVTEFKSADPVSLTLVTNRFHDDSDLVEQVEEFVTRIVSAKGGGGIPTIFIVDEHVPDAKMPQLYRSMDCFVLPSRGEGWGRPHVEAMSMGLPVIATNWSGPTAFLTEDNGYPLAIDGLETIRQGPFRKYHKWSIPSVSHLQQLMRQAATQRDEAAAKGVQARADMLRRFTPKQLERV